ncbi:hypothetical protein ABIB30_004444 [Pedobacter sp. UYP1]
MEKQLFMVIFNGKFLKGILGGFIFKLVDGVHVVSKRNQRISVQTAYLKNTLAAY